mmetsp:Transcript_14871/g.42162  ORF Transcript_14871/g.42162 Transcript_14871/m.42162 type:complete len:222 (+) Transcript_14871:899-1564(+)
MTRSSSHRVPLKRPRRNSEIMAAPDIRMCDTMDGRAAQRVQTASSWSMAWHPMASARPKARAIAMIAMMDILYIATNLGHSGTSQLRMPPMRKHVTTMRSNLPFCSPSSLSSAKRCLRKHHASLGITSTSSFTRDSMTSLFFMTLVELQILGLLGPCPSDTCRELLCEDIRLRGLFSTVPSESPPGVACPSLLSALPLSPVASLLLSLVWSGKEPLAAGPQ